MENADSSERRSRRVARPTLKCILNAQQAASTAPTKGIGHATCSRASSTRTLRLSPRARLAQSKLAVAARQAKRAAKRARDILRADAIRAANLRRRLELQGGTQSPAVPTRGSIVPAPRAPAETTAVEQRPSAPSPPLQSPQPSRPLPDPPGTNPTSPSTSPCPSSRTPDSPPHTPSSRASPPAAPVHSGPPELSRFSVTDAFWVAAASRRLSPGWTIAASQGPSSAPPHDTAAQCTTFHYHPPSGGLRLELRLPLPPHPDTGTLQVYVLTQASGCILVDMSAGRWASAADNPFTRPITCVTDVLQCLRYVEACRRCAGLHNPEYQQVSAARGHRWCDKQGRPYALGEAEPCASAVGLLQWTIRSIGCAQLVPPDSCARRPACASCTAIKNKVRALVSYKQRRGGTGTDTAQAAAAAAPCVSSSRPALSVMPWDVK